MKNIIHKIWNFITSILVIVVFVFASSLVIPKFIGMDIYVVLSGSMEPTYKTGGIIYVQNVETTDLEIDDVITFQLNENVIATHRIVEIINDDSGLAYRTKGDANDNVDANLVRENQVIGTPILTIPYMGYIISYIQNPPGTYMAIALGVSVVLMVILSDLLFEDEDTGANSVNIENERKEKEDEKE